MKAVVYKGPFNVAVEEVEDPAIVAPTDAVLKVTSAAICGSDLHMYEGRTAAQPGVVFGHEIMGVIDKVGDAVTTLSPGERVVVPFNIACGFCFNCVRGFTNACLTVNPEGIGGGYGYVGMGHYRGGQAEYVRVPYAEVNCLKLPGEPHDEREDDFVLLADVFPTGYHGAVLAGVHAGTSVAVFGAGPVGLMAAYSSILMGASEVYVVDYIPERLKKALELGATPIDFTKGDPVEQIMKKRRERGPRPGEEKMTGVMCGIDAVGYQALDVGDPLREKPTQVLEDLLRLVNRTGMIGIVGVYFTNDPKGVDCSAQQGIYAIPFAKAFEKAISIGIGQTPVKRYNMFLRDLIISGRAKPGFIVSDRLPLSEAAEGYRRFDARIEGSTKVILKC